MKSRTIPFTAPAPRRTRVPTRLACVTLLAVSQSGWAGSTSAPLRISMNLVDRCEVRSPSDRTPADARCSPGVARAVTVVSSASQTTPRVSPQTGPAATSFPLPKEAPATPDVVAIVF